MASSVSDTAVAVGPVVCGSSSRALGGGGGEKRHNSADVNQEGVNLMPRAPEELLGLIRASERLREGVRGGQRGSAWDARSSDDLSMDVRLSISEVENPDACVAEIDGFVDDNVFRSPIGLENTCLEIMIFYFFNLKVVMKFQFHISFCIFADQGEHWNT